MNRYLRTISCLTFFDDSLIGKITFMPWHITPVTLVLSRGSPLKVQVEGNGYSVPPWRPHFL